MHNNNGFDPSQAALVGERQQQRFRTGAALLVALAVFAQESAWNFYDAQVPVSLRQYTSSAALIGLLMGMDNLLGIFIQPWVAHRSDNTRTRWGRRIPYLLIGAPVAAFFYVLIPWANSMPALVGAMFCYALVANSFKAVTEALVPDFQAPHHRGKALAFTKIAVAFTVAVSAALSFLVIDRSPHLAFAIPALLLVGGMGIAALGLDEKTAYANQSPEAQAEGPGMGFRALLLDIWRDTDKSRLVLIAAIFVIGGTWSALRSQLTTYAMEVLELSRGKAGSVGFPAGVAFMLVAFPLAMLSDRGRRLRICKAGMALFVAGCLLAHFAGSVTMTTVGVAVCSVGFAAFVVNAVVILWNQAPSPLVLGAYTGIYGIALAVGSTLMPALLGLLVDATAWRYMMLHTAALGLLGMALLSRVKTEQRQPPGPRP